MRSILARDSEQIQALCEARERLKDEGWAEIEDVRNELIYEMKRVRANRASETGHKHLELEVE